VNRIEIGSESIGGHLEFSGCGLMEFFRESHCISGGTSPEMPSQYQFTGPFDGDKTVGVPKFRITGLVMLLFAAYEAPNLIALHVRHRHASTFALKQPLTAITGKHQNLHDCVLVDTSEPLNRTDGATLDQQVDN
jgi:hypothetical protein